MRNNLVKIKDGPHVINFDELKSIKIHWIALYMNGNNIIYFDTFGVKQVLKKKKSKNL